MTVGYTQPQDGCAVMKVNKLLTSSSVGLHHLSILVDTATDTEGVFIIDSGHHKLSALQRSVAQHPVGKPSVSPWSCLVLVHDSG
jgi:hypothetical protein